MVAELVFIAGFHGELVEDTEHGVGSSLMPHDMLLYSIVEDGTL